MGDNSLLLRLSCISLYHEKKLKSNKVIILFYCRLNGLRNIFTTFHE